MCPSHTLSSLARLGTPRGRHSRYAAYTDERIRGPQGLPLTKPPYGRITAIDMRTGDHLWMRALGSGPVNHPALQGLDLPDLGWGVRFFCAGDSHAAAGRLTGSARRRWALRSKSARQRVD